MSRRRLSLRARLLTLQLVVFGSFLLLASPVTYFIMSRTLEDDRDEYLTSMARHVSKEYLAKDENVPPSPSLPARCLCDPVPPSSTDPEAMHWPRHLLLCDESGEVLCSDGETAALAPQAVQQALQTNLPAFADVRWPAEFLRIIAWPFQDPNGRVLVMEVGCSYRVIEGALRKGFILMAVIDAAALLFLITGSYLLTRNAFVPIDQIVRRVEQIDEDRLEERLPMESRDDEAGRLVAVINRMLERLERAFEAQSRFSSDVAHEIRSPLTALRGMMEVTLRKERSTEEYRNVMQENLEEVLRLARLAEDLMSLAKADAGVLQIRRVRVKLREALQAVLARFKLKADEKNIELRLHAPEEVAVIGDPDLLGRLVENLVDNALIHSPQMGAVLVQLQRNEDHVTISVDDHGTGIPPQHLSKIFDRFYRVDPARSREMGGSGLGLAIAQQIARQHGGSIRVQSTVGKGSVFLVTIPVARPPEPRMETG